MGVLSLRSRLDDQTGLVGKDDRLHSVAQVQLRQDPVDVGFDRGLADHECFGDLIIGEPAAEHGEHFEFGAG